MVNFGNTVLQLSKSEAL